MPISHSSQGKYMYSHEQGCYFSQVRLYRFIFILLSTELKDERTTLVSFFFALSKNKSEIDTVQF